MSKQPRQTVRKKIRINEEKSIPGTSCPAASAVGEGLLTRHSHYWKKKSSSMRPGRRLKSLLPEFLGQIHSLFCQNRYSYGVAVCCMVLKISFTSLLPPDREQSVGPQQGPWDNPKMLGCWDLQLFPADPPTSEALCLGQAFCSVLPLFSSFYPELHIIQSPPTPFKLLPQLGTLKG